MATTKTLTAKTTATVAIPGLGGKQQPLAVHTKTHDKTRSNDGTVTETPLDAPRHSLVYAPDGDTGRGFSGIDIPVPFETLEDGDTASVKVGRTVFPVELSPGVYGKTSKNPRPMLQGSDSRDGLRATVRWTRNRSGEGRLTVTVTRAPQGGGRQAPKLDANPFA